MAAASRLRCGKKSRRNTPVKTSATFSAPCRSTASSTKTNSKKQIDEWIRVFRNTKPASGTNGPLIPGDPEREAEAIRSKEGIPLIQPVVDKLLDIAGYIKEGRG